MGQTNAPHRTNPCTDLSLMSTLITLSDVSFSYDHRRTILSDISLSIAERDFIVLRGKNGGGKTSLLKIIAGLLSPTSGTIERANALTTGYLPQHRSIDRQFPITVFQTVRSGLQCTLPWWKPFGQSERATTMNILESLNLLELAQRPISSLSGGQWQRTLLARALVSSPQLLLLDEPDTHLDTVTRQELYATLLAEHQQRAIVVVSHDAHFPLPEGVKIIEIG